MNINFPIVEEEVLDRNGVVIPNKKLVRRTDTNHVLSVVSNNKTTISNQDLLKAIPEGFSLQKETIQNYGSTCRAVFVNNSHDLEVNGEKLRPMITMTNSFEGSCSYSFKGGIYRLVCENGLMSGSDFIRVKGKREVNPHKKLIEVDFTRLPNILEKFKVAAEKDLSKEDIDKFFNEMIKRNKLTNQKAHNIINMLDQKEDLKAGSNVWTLYNAIEDLSSNYTSTIQQQNSYDKLALEVLKMAA